MSSSRIDAEPGFVLHSYPFRETSLIVEVFSQKYGRIALLARGARRPRSVLRGLMMAFQPLELSWAGRGEVKTLMKAEWQGGLPLLTGEALFYGYYLNELLIDLMPREDPHPPLFSTYFSTLQKISVHPEESALRFFERTLLQSLGYGVVLTHDIHGAPILPEASYYYEIERGLVPSAIEAPDSEFAPMMIYGQTLLDLVEGAFSTQRSQLEARQLMRTLITHYMGGKQLESRKIFRALQAL